jgi:mono/diheme cytochrome c family protein
MFLLRTTATLFMLISTFSTHATSATEDSSVTLNKTELSQGLEIFHFHCSRCHGRTAEGDGRFAIIYRRLHSSLPSNFTMGYFESRPAAYLKTIISDGGEANQRSKYMPPFGDALNSREIDLLVKIIQKTGADKKLPVMTDSR